MNKLEKMVDVVKKIRVNETKENVINYLSLVDNVNDKIVIAQHFGYYDEVLKLFKELDMTDYQRNKYENLLKQNIDLYKTLNPEILNPKYEFLDEIFDILVTDINIQQNLLSLSDNQLLLFKQIYVKLKEYFSYSLSQIANILWVMGKNAFSNDGNYHISSYELLLKDIDEHFDENYDLSNDDLDKIIFIFTQGFDLQVNSLEDIKSLNIKDKMIKFNNSIIEEERYKKNKCIDNIKDVLLTCSYGISLEEAERMLKIHDISGIDITNDNKGIFEVFLSICRICKEKDPNVLIRVYDEFIAKKNPNESYLRSMVIDCELRKLYADNINKCLYKINQKDFVSSINDVDIYEVNSDFKILMTAIGAYQADFKDQVNYSEYWNSNYILSHCNSCSLISNSNLTMATVRNVILGFNDMDPNSLYSMAPYDLNSAPKYELFSPVDLPRSIYMNPDKLINCTRCAYNELVYERRDLSPNRKKYKKNPDYIVFVETFEDYDKLIDKYQDDPDILSVIYNCKKEDEYHFRESLKAAKDFGIPIVKINREKCARNEDIIINNMVEKFMSKPSLDIFHSIVTRVENNRIGNTEKTFLIRDKYFSTEKISQMIDKLIMRINDIEDDKVRQKMLEDCWRSLNESVRRWKVGGPYRRKDQRNGINYSELMKRLEDMIDCVKGKGK